MTYLVEDPTYPLIALGLAAMACLVALQVTQQGKFLVWGASLLGLGVVLFGVERLVVTDTERVEGVVYDLASAVSRSDVAAVEALLAPEVALGLTTEVERGRRGPVEGISPFRLLPILRQARFDFIKVRQLQARAGAQTKRGTAEFKVSVSGVAVAGNSGVDQPFAAANTEWSLGFREVSPGVWRVTRITAISLPRYAAPFVGGVTNDAGGEAGAKPNRGRRGINRGH